jgi:hypothetical protein
MTKICDECDRKDQCVGKPQLTCDYQTALKELTWAEFDVRQAEERLRSAQDKLQDRRKSLRTIIDRLFE